MADIHKSFRLFSDPTSENNDSAGPLIPEPSSKLFDEANDLLIHRQKLLDDLHIEQQNGDIKTDESKPRQGIIQHDISNIDKKLIEQKPRANKIRMILESYYDSMARYQNLIHRLPNSLEPMYPGVEGIWNPLQIIRNRRIRKKNGDTLRKGELGKFKLPSTVFSKYGKQHLIWQINPYEIAGDLDWREGKWEELRNSKGKKWFSSENSPSISNKTVGVNRMHERLFNDEGVEDDERVNSLRKVNESSASLARFEPYKKKHSIPLNNMPTIKMENSSAGMNSGGSSNNSEVEDRCLSFESFSSEIAEYDNEELLDLIKIMKGMKYYLKISNFKINAFEVKIDDKIHKNEIRFRNKLEHFENLKNLNNDKCQVLLNKIEEIDNEIEQINQFNFQKSNKIEELLGYCDRSNGEINTSITLKFRTLMEKKDQLGLNEKKVIVSIFYQLIESLIVILLWMIWIFVESWIWLRKVIFFIIKLIRWILL